MLPRSILRLHPVEGEMKRLNLLIATLYVGLVSAAMFAATLAEAAPSLRAPP